MVPYSTKPAQALDIVAGLNPDSTTPVVDSDSVLGRCRAHGVRLHVFGLNSPEWMRWWIRLGVDSFDGSKLSTEGAVNGWYWIPLDGKHGRPHHRSHHPSSAGDMYARINVKNIGLTDTPERWRPSNGRWRPRHDFVTAEELGTACGALPIPRPSKVHQRPVLGDENLARRTACPGWCGSTEHNMGRMTWHTSVIG